MSENLVHLCKLRICIHLRLFLILDIPTLVPPFDWIPVAQLISWLWISSPVSFCQLLDEEYAMEIRVVRNVITERRPVQVHFPLGLLARSSLWIAGNFPSIRLLPTSKRLPPSKCLSLLSLSFPPQINQIFLLFSHHPSFPILLFFFPAPSLPRRCYLIPLPRAIPVFSSYVLLCYLVFVGLRIIAWLYI